MKTPSEVEVRDHGIDHAQYFQGCGVSFTNFDCVYTGCGSNFAEAYDDALEQYASVGAWDENAIDALCREQIGKDPATLTEPNTDAYHEECEDSEMYYYVSILVK